MAARDRYGGFGEQARTPLQRYILNACDPQNFEPNLALNLEITDIINQKKGSAPREAAVAIVHYINHRNPNVALLALSLLDICVKNCGYPFHLQISTKEFLNELVRKFPERPPVRPTRVQHKILELIEEWRQTICQTSRYKEDLGFIRDMHRLLSYKGYLFPEIKREDAAVLNPSDNLRSAEEMEEEEREAQSAKLQELIRRGGPQDLQEANKLMKIMAGFDTRNKTDYRAKAAEEVVKVQQKAKLLEEMLQRYKPGDEIKEGDVFEEMANALASAHPKIQRMCEEESDDHEAVAKLLEINDSIHRTLRRYRLTKKGDLDAANKIPKGTLGTSGAGVSKGPDNELSLIDLGGSEELPAQHDVPSGPVPSSHKGNALEDDLLGLSIGGDTYGQGGAVSLGTNVVPGPSSGAPKASIPSILQQFNTPSPAPPPPTTTYDIFGSLAGKQPSAPSPSMYSQPASQPTRPSDPFAALSGSASTPRQGSPSPFQHSVQPAVPTSSLLDLGSDPTPPAGSPPASTASAAQPDGDDEWTFTSALPDQSVEVTVANTSIRVVFAVVRETDDMLHITSKISNNTAQPVSELMFLLAAPRAYRLQLEPQSGRNLSPRQTVGITQIVRLYGVERGKGTAIKMRWKASYVVGTERKEEQGEIATLGVS